MPDQASTSRAAGRRGRWPLVVAAAALAAALAAAVVVVLDGGDGELRLDGVPQGVSARAVDGEPVFLVRDGDDVRVFAADARHLPDDTLWWCPNEDLFFEVEHGSQFARDGRKIGGPARGGLNEHPAEVDDGRLVVDTGRVVEGTLEPRAERPDAMDDVDWSLPANSGPGSFCDGAVQSPSGTAPPGSDVGGH